MGDDSTTPGIVGDDSVTYIADMLPVSMCCGGRVTSPLIDAYGDPVSIPVDSVRCN